MARYGSLNGSCKQLVAKASGTSERTESSHRHFDCKFIEALLVADKYQKKDSVAAAIPTALAPYLSKCTLQRQQGLARTAAEFSRRVQMLPPKVPLPIYSYPARPSEKLSVSTSSEDMYTAMLQNFVKISKLAAHGKPKNIIKAHMSGLLSILKVFASPDRPL